MTQRSEAADAGEAWDVIVVDDNPDDLAEVRRLLLRGSGRAYRFTEAKTGEAAIRAVMHAPGGPPDCLVLDFHLPDMNAIDVLEAIRGDDRLPACPVVVVTGEVGQDKGRAVLRAGAQDYIGKDWLCPPALTRAVENAVDRFALARQLRTREAAIEESEQRFRAVIESVPAGILALDPDGRITLANRRAVDLTGYRAEELLGRPLEEFLAEGVRGRFRELRGRLDDAPATDSPGLERGFSLVRKDGSRFPAELGLASVPGAGPTELAMVVDVSELIKAEEALRWLNADLERRVAERTEELAKLVAILDASTDFIGIAGPDGRIVWANRRALAEVGDLGAQATDVHTPDSVRAIFKEGLPAAARDGHWLGETEVIARDGRIIPVSQLILSHKDPEGRVAYYSSIMRDMTERRRVEMELARATRLKDEFLANMSHELRTPLTGVMGLAESLSEGIYGPLNEAQRRCVIDVQECGQHLLSLINDILDVAKIGAGMLRLEPGPVEVTSACKSAINFVKEALLKKSIALQVAFDEQAGRVVADGRRLKQILVNLLSNAVKFTDPGGKIGLEVRGDASGRTVTFVVWDTGIGISPEGLKSIFRPFAQLDAGLSRNRGGTGLGLSLVKSLTELQGGTLDVHSEEGKGSRFAVALPSEVPEPAGRDEPDAATGDSAARGQDPVPPRGSPRILIVDDDVVGARVARDYLGFKGLDVQIVHDAAAGIAAVRDAAPDLIVMDIQMPGMDGLDAIRHIRAMPGKGDAPILAFTALAMKGDRERILQAGATDYLTKPTSLVELHRRIRELLAAREARGPR